MSNNKTDCQEIVNSTFDGVPVICSRHTAAVLEMRVIEGLVPPYTPMARVEFWIDGVGSIDGPTAVLFATTKDALQKVYDKLFHQLDNVVLVDNRW